MKKELEVHKYDPCILEKVGCDGELLSLTDLWKAAGSPKSQNPNDWLRLDATQQLIETASQILNTVLNRIIKTKRGKSGGSYAHKNIALAYAKYLDPALHVLVNEVFFQRLEEEKNPDLAVDRAIKGYKRKGRSNEWIAKRLEAKGLRNIFTSTLSEHGVERDGYKNCTNAIYQPLFGGTSEFIRSKYAIEKGKNIRDNLPLVEIQAISFAEVLAADDIKKNNRRGNVQCELSSRAASMAVRASLLEHRKHRNNAIK